MEQDNRGHKKSIFETRPVIIATNNQDKFTQIADIFQALNVKINKFVSPKDLDIQSEQSESGSIYDRAKQKALNCLSLLKPEDLEKYSCIIANDAATKLPSLNIVTTESRKLATQILAGELLKPGDPLHYIYAFAVILLPGKKMFTTTAEIPFTYLGNPNAVKLSTEHKNTMNEVKALVGQNIPHSNLPEREVTQYRLKYLKKGLQPIINKINKQK